MKELNHDEAEAVGGGLTGFEIAFLGAAAAYVVSHWGDVKSGFADGFLAGYQGTSL